MAMRIPYSPLALASAALTRVSARPHLSPLHLAWNLSSCATGHPSRHLHGPSPSPRHRRRGRSALAFAPRERRHNTHSGTRGSLPRHVSAFARSHSHGSAVSPRRYHSVARFRTAVPTTSPSPQKNILSKLPRHSHPPSSRLFCGRPNAPDSPTGAIDLSDDRENDPSAAVPIDLAALHRTIDTTRDILGYPAYGVSLSLVDDDFMAEINGAARDVPAPTDVLSFCFQDDFVRPGVLGAVQFDAPDYYNLGDMLIDVDYVKRKCEEDRTRHGTEEWKSRQGPHESVPEGHVVSERVATAALVPRQEEGTEDDGYEYEYIEVEVDEYDDRGVAPQMQYVYDPEIRIHMLIVHGMLHLVGYDHIEDDDYELMVVREDEVLAELRTRLGEDFGVHNRLLPAGDTAPADVLSVS